MSTATVAGRRKGSASGMAGRVEAAPVGAATASRPYEAWVYSKRDDE